MAASLGQDWGWAWVGLAWLGLAWFFVEVKVMSAPGSRYQDSPANTHKLVQTLTYTNAGTRTPTYRNKSVRFPFVFLYVIFSRFSCFLLLLLLLLLEQRPFFAVRCLGPKVVDATKLMDYRS